MALIVNEYFMCVGNRQSDPWPVMVWFHGGDFNTGTPAIWDASIFVTKQKVRLRALGTYEYLRNTAGN